MAILLNSKNTRKPTVKAVFCLSSSFNSTYISCPNQGVDGLIYKRKRICIPDYVTVQLSKIYAESKTIILFFTKTSFEEKGLASVFADGLMASDSNIYLRHGWHERFFYNGP